MEKGKRVSIRQLQLRNLEELQAYQRLGTVEELKSMKENGAFSGVELAQIYAMQRKLRQYQELGTVEEFKALKEKNMAKTLSKHLIVSKPTILDCDTLTLIKEIEEIAEKGACSGVNCETCPYTNKCFEGEMSEQNMAIKIIDLIKKHSI